ncbi:MULTISPECIES: acetyl-CoA C-acetyltransferase [unclassified Cryobacterium]|uniref:acetyl-CoA C-acetyltransferase n=1 Tax=unclassified Cryobacterium TaxID=2649013 RepID=UPI002AB4921A|nr:MULTISPECIES: acetyl-CoA C-acetyltransferase [unclassified Cryobacterium]MDY7526585.1 acetyl-CoA C-acetyltransferase [Cryobacterium sp. 10C2]MDY7557608.1 acetyl-CoA C-acetyltransferase [Cryobacterium sp. 10C3]MEB0290551.1 acetyl-CoA C-acetyltransferase [Cryobacterium sp. 10C2]
MREVVVCEPLRTPIGRFGGMFAGVAPVDLAAAVIRALVARTAIDTSRIDDILFGQGYPSAEAAPIGRVAALDAGLPVTVGGSQVDRRCGSGLQAILDGCMQIQTGVSDVVIAGGADSMSQAPLYAVNTRWGIRGTDGFPMHDALGRARQTAGGRSYPVPGGMIETAENLRREFGISRQAQDELALRSQARAADAVASGTFDQEIVPVSVWVKGVEKVISADETPRQTAIEDLERLKPILLKTDAEATVTAGNASTQNDAAAACILTTPEIATELGLTPIVKLRSWARAGVEPSRMGIGPVPATHRALDRAGLSLSDMSLIELNEAFAAQVLAVAHEWGLTDNDWERTNVLGSGISLGHPVGATGARILATGSRELARRGGDFLLETMCIGGGQGLAAVWERV